MTEPLRILFAIQTLEGRAGGSLHVYDLALEALRRGHRPVIFSTRLGALAADLRRLTVAVVDRLDLITAAPDIIHGHSPIETVAALLHFPQTPAVFTCHAWDSPDALPPVMPGLLRYIAVDDTCRDHLVLQSGIPDDRVLVRYNAVDLLRFQRGAPRPARPTRALVFSNNAADSNYLPAVRAACEAAGLALDVAGDNSQRSVDRPEDILGHYDIVFAKARCAAEALASGAAVVVCDILGIAAMVTTTNYADVRRMNFGRRLLQRPVTTAAVAAEIAKYNAEDAARVTEHVRATEGVDAAFESIAAIYREAITEAKSREAIGDAELRRAAAGFLERIAWFSNTFYAPQMLKHAARETAALRVRLDQLESALRMEPLSEPERRAIRVTGVRAPAAVVAGDQFGIVLDVANDGARWLASTNPAPMFVSYHWMSEDGSQVIVADELRTPLAPFIGPKQQAACAATVQAPGAPGRYRLRASLVQEHHAWLDWLGAGHYADTLVSVRATHR